MSKLTRKTRLGNRLTPTQRAEMTAFLDAMGRALNDSGTIETMEISEAVILAVRLRDIVVEMTDETSVWLGGWIEAQKAKGRKKRRTKK